VLGALRDVAVGRVRPRAVLLDALGTLVELETPWPHLVRALAARGVVGVPEADAERAMRAEMAFYRAHHDEASDWPGLEDLRARCARLVRAELGLSLPEADVLDALLEALRFRAFGEVTGVLRALRARETALVVVSNWDVSLHDVLVRTGLSELVDAVVTSAELGAAKPDPAIFRAALERAGGIAPSAALHVGDSLDADVAGARAAGLEAVLVARDGAPAPAGVRTIRSLDGLLSGAQEAPPTLGSP
jgi:putative hydrolase of the HAD superfamily